MIILIDAKEAFDNIQHPFVIENKNKKALQKVSIEELTSTQ